MPISYMPWGWLAWIDLAGRSHAVPIARRHHRQLFKMRAAAMKHRPDIQRVWISRKRP